MSKVKFLFVFSIVVLLSCQDTFARGIKIPMGNREVLVKVADLPDTEEYMTGDSVCIDLGRIHEEYNIAYFLPLSVQKEPRLVGYDEKSDTYYELTEEQLNTILKDNNLDGEKLNQLGFYTRYGGKLVGLLLVGLIIWGVIPSKKKKTKATEV